VPDKAAPQAGKVMLAEIERQVSQRGEDGIENIVLLCPSHHVAVHRCNAPFNYAELAFVFTNHRGPLKDNSHLVKSA
jgi:hypothetical protein